MTNKNKYNLRDARMAKRNNSARLAAYANAKAEIKKFYEEFLEACKWLATESSKPEYADRFMLYEMCVRGVLDDERDKWNQLIINLSVTSNEKFSRHLPHTWGQLGDAKKLMQVYDSIDIMNKLWAEYIKETENCSEYESDYIWKKSYEVEYEMEQAYYYGALKSWRN